MKVYISADMEGVTGVTHPEDVIPGRSRYEGFRKLLTADVNAAIEGAAEGGATEFIVNEAHDGMRNIVLEGLDLRAEVIVGRRKPFVMMEDVGEADVAFFVGYHAGAGTNGVLSHTFRTAPVVGVTLNDEPCSEGRMNAAYAGLRGIPVDLVSGDDAVCEESSGLYTGVQTAQVKTAIAATPPGACRLRRRTGASGMRQGRRSKAPRNSEPTSSSRPTPSPWSSTTLARRPASSTSRGSSGQTTV